MTDLHCHILPGVDDGPDNLRESLLLLQSTYESGVKNIVFTCHFNCEEMSITDFLERRNASFARLQKAVACCSQLSGNMHFKLGAEVRYSPNLKDYDLRPLCFTNTDYLLLELPSDHMVYYFDNIIFEMRIQGIIPLMAHIERYLYVMDHLPTLYHWVQKGLLIQVNAGTLLEKTKTSKLLLKLIQWKLVHVLSSDAHSLDKRPQNLAKGLSVVRSRLGHAEAERLIFNGESIFNGSALLPENIYCPRKILGRWR